MNSLSIQVLAVPDPRDDRAFLIATRPFVDGSPILKGDDIVRLTELLLSVREEGTRTLFACHCGEPGCGGYFEGVEVRQYETHLTWVDRDLLSSWFKYEFERTQYREAVERAMRDVRSLLPSDDRCVCFQSGIDYELFPEWLARSEPATVGSYTSPGLWGFRRARISQ